MLLAINVVVPAETVVLLFTVSGMVAFAAVVVVLAPGTEAIEVSLALTMEKRPE